MITRFFGGEDVFYKKAIYKIKNYLVTKNYNALKNHIIFFQNSEIQN